MSDPFELKRYIRTIPDFPKAGILFRDVTTLFNDPQGLRKSIDCLTNPFIGQNIDRVVGIEARGFILGGAMAHQLSVGFAPARKAGKLPWDRIAQDYTLEYGQATLEMHKDAIQAGEEILLVDDLLATGGTAKAAIQLLRRLGAKAIHCAFLVELPELEGRRVLEELETSVYTLCQFQGH